MKLFSGKMKKTLAMLLAVIMIMGIMPSSLLVRAADGLMEVLVPPSLTIDSIYAFSEGRARFQSAAADWAYGFIDETGAAVIPAQFFRAGHFNDGLAAVMVGDNWDTARWGFINRAGEMVIEPQFLWVAEFNNGTATVEFEDGTMGPIDRTGAAVAEHAPFVPHVGDRSFYVDWDVDDDGNWGLGINHVSGVTVLPPVYQHILIGDDGLTLVLQNGLWGIVRLGAAPLTLEGMFGSDIAARIRPSTGPDGFADYGYEIWRAAEGDPTDGFIGVLPYAGAALREVSDYVDRQFISRGPFEEFSNVWLYNHATSRLELLRTDIDYVAEEASTRITIRAQTFENMDQGTNTIIADFRVADDTARPVRVAAQTFNVNTRTAARPAVQREVGEGTHMATADVHVRSGPRATYAPIGVLPRNTAVEVINQVNPYWARIQFTATRTGFVNTPFLAPIADADLEAMTARTVTAHRLNVRNGPGTSHGIVGVLHNGDVVAELGTVGNWVRISYSYGGFTNVGYVFGRYLD